MISFFYLIAKKSKEKNSKWSNLTYKICKLLVNVFYPISQRFRTDFSLDLGASIIVSLTSYPARIKVAWVTIASLLNQAQRPYKIILWLAQEQFPSGVLPKNLTRLCKRGLEICYCEDIKPHKKYYYTIQKYPEYFIVTADDDIFYPENHLQKLWQGHKKYPETVVCNWSAKIIFKSNTEFAEYKNWSHNSEETPSFFILPIGCNGVLYPPHCFSKEIIDMEVIKKIALFTDDLWLKCMEVLNNYKAVNYEKVPLIYFNNLMCKNTGLWIINSGKENCRNDKVWKDLMAYYPQISKVLLNSTEHGKSVFS